MTMKHFYAITAMAFFTGLSSVVLTSCNDDSYPPVTLVSVADNNNFTAQSTITINAFSNGIDFKIKGGNGFYLIQNNDKNIIDFRYDGSTLTILPVSIGNGSIVISDNAGNSSTINVEVKNKANSFEVTGIESIALGMDLTLREMENIKKEISNNTFVYEGGKFMFTYTNESQDEGSVSIYADNSNSYTTGIFSQEQKYDSNDGSKYLEYTLTLTDNEKHILKLNEEIISSDSVSLSFYEDVASEYRVKYPELEEAYLVINIKPSVSE